MYRTLALLRREGVVNELHLAEGHLHYEMVAAGSAGEGGKGGHGHLVCRGCGRVEEFTSPALSRLLTTLGRRFGYDPTAAQVEIVGRCTGCAPPAAPAARPTLLGA